MKVLLAIPSKNRVGVLEKNTFPWLSKVACDWKIFVEPQDVVDYSHAFGFGNVKDIGSNNRGLGYAKDFIQSYAKAAGYDLIFKLDDDIRSFTDFRRRTTPEECADLVTKMIETFKTTFEKYPNLHAIGFPYSFEMYEKVRFEPIKRLQTAYIVKTQYFTAPIETSVFEDFAVGINILVNGGRILKYGLSGIDMGVKVGGGEGGHQSFDRKAQALKEIEELKKLYPPLTFKKVQKPWGIEPNIRSIKL